MSGSLFPFVSIAWILRVLGGCTTYLYLDAEELRWRADARKQVVRLRFCAHAACHRLVKGLPGALCIYHDPKRDE